MIGDFHSSWTAVSKSEYIVNQSLIYVEEPDVEEKLLLEDKSMDPLSTQRNILSSTPESGLSRTFFPKS